MRGAYLLLMGFVIIEIAPACQAFAEISEGFGRMLTLFL